MRVSTFFAATLPAAMAQVREALGPKAVVLSWRNTRGGIEISASLEASQSEPAPLRQAPARATQPRQQAPTTTPHNQEDLLANHFSPDDFLPKQMPPTPARAGQAQNTRARGLAALVKRQTSSAAEIASQSRRQALPQPIRAMPTAPVPIVPIPMAPVPMAPVKTTPDTPTPHARLTTFLVRAGLTKGQAEDLAGHASGDLRRALSDCLAKALVFSPIEATPPKPLILVGPPGAGKSSCAAKLAARTIAAGHDVLLISADSERCGGADQLAALAKRLGARFEAVTTLGDLNELVGEARARGIVVFIDAPSACPAQDAEIRATYRLIEETRLEAVLCLPADMRPDDMEDLAKAYQAIGISRAIATRLDLTTRRASIFHALKSANLALAQMSATPYISGGVAIATATRAAALLLEPFEDALAEDAA
jgi:flagellar biosynthesis protein FlhF